MLNVVYLRVAVALTKWENHRTETQYSDALTIKLFAFQVPVSSCCRPPTAHRSLSLSLGPACLPACLPG